MEMLQKAALATSIGQKVKLEFCKVNLTIFSFECNLSHAKSGSFFVLVAIVAK